MPHPFSTASLQRCDIKQQLCKFLASTALCCNLLAGVPLIAAPAIAQEPDIQTLRRTPENLPAPTPGRVGPVRAGTMIPPAIPALSTGTPALVMPRAVPVKPAPPQSTPVKPTSVAAPVRMAPSVQPASRTAATPAASRPDVQTIRRPVASAAPVGETLRRPVPSSTLPQLDVPLRGPAPVATTGRLRQPSGPYEAQIIRGTTGREISPLSRQPFGGQRKALEPQTLPMLPMYASPQPLPAPMTAPDSLPAPQDMTTVANLPPSQGITATDSTASPASQTPEATAASSDPVPLQPLPNATVSTETSVAEAPAPAPDASTAASADAPPLAEGTLKVETITEGGITALQEETQISVLPSLPEEVKQSLDKVPSGLRTPREPLPDTKPGRLSVDHATYPDLLREDLDMDAPDAVGMNISIKKAPVEVEGLLQDAYAALEANDLKQAASLYAEVLGIAPRNEDALFALATLYHSQNQTEDALPLYQRLLTINPAHQDGLNNYLALVASLSPEEALQKLAELEARNPDLASIHAQKSVAYARLGKKTEAIEAIQTALRMDPQNTEYRYNFAILLDEAGYYEDAATLYSQLLQTHRSGGQIPGDPTTIQERLTFILSNNS